MSATALQALVPLMALASAIVLVMLVIAWHRHHGLTAALTALGLLATVASLPVASKVAPQGVTDLLMVDGYALFYGALAVLAALVVVALSFSYLHRWTGRREEWYLLLMTATLGALVLASARHLAAFVLGLELLSVSLFALVGYPTAVARPLEAATKYLVLAGVSSAFLLFGMALVYARFGVLDFATLQAASAPDGGLLLPAAIALMVIGIGFKLSLVPFHLWTPDVFQGAPAPVAAFLATVSKGAVFALLLRYVQLGGGYQLEPVLGAIALLAIVTMLVGNLLALAQRDLKRLLAYSSIAHFGYLLVALLAGGEFAVESIGFYLAAYFATTLAAFGVVTVLATEGGDSHREAEDTDLERYRGLLWRRPLLAVLLVLALLSLAGLPVTVGFVAKFYVIAAGADAGAWTLVGTLVLGSIIGLFYYLRIALVVADLDITTAAVPSSDRHWSQAPAQIALSLLGLFILVFGAFPELIIVTSQAGLEAGP